MSKKFNKPKVVQNPGDRKSRAQHQPNGNRVAVKENPGSTDHQTPAWQFNLCDKDHELWGWGKLKPLDFIGLIRQHLHSFENMAWSQIKQAAGGRSSGTNSHPLAIEGFAIHAKKRLQQLNHDDVDELFSLRLTNTLRLYGIRDGRVLKFIWHDPYHGSKDGAYPTKNVK